MKRVQKLIRGADPHWVGDGFPVRTFFSYTDGPAFSPFLLLDHAGPARFEPSDRARGVGSHPHRGFETVTIVYDGEVEHRDSTGNGGRIGPGDVQWMTAASGIVHEEMHGADFARRGGTLEMVQLWVNLPARDKMAPPRYQGLTAASIPTVQLAGGAGSVRVIAGRCGGANGPAQTFTPIDLWDVRLEPGRSTALELPAGRTALLMVLRGGVRVAGADDVPAAAMAILDRAGDTLELTAGAEGARALLMSGEPIDEPVVGYGPFVMNTRAEIGKAIDDFQSGRMGTLAD
jgi:redox-sensitive bicupin YhaK (pirin superfamily)